MVQVLKCRLNLGTGGWWIAARWPVMIVLLFCQISSPKAQGQTPLTDPDPENMEGESENNGESNLPALVQPDDDSEFMDELKFLEDSSFVETASRHRQEIGTSPAAITVITRQEIEATGANNIEDLLRIVPGMETIIVSQSYTGLSTRLRHYTENRYFLVLMDGRDIMLELLGMSYMPIQPITLYDIERIEVIRGPGSALYGANAFCGVINISSLDFSQKDYTSIRIQGGEFGNLAFNARSKNRLFGNLSSSLSASYDRAAGFANPLETGKEAWKFRPVLRYDFSDSEHLMLDYGVSRIIGSVPTMMGPTDIDYLYSTLKLSYQSPSVSGHLYWILGQFDTNTTTPLEYHGIVLAKLVPSYAEFHTLDGEFQWNIPKFWERLLLITGVGTRFSYLTSGQFLDPTTFMDNSSPAYHQPGLDYWEARAGLFVHGELEAADWLTATADVRVDYNTTTDFFISPRATLIFKPISNQFLRLSVARAFRKPSFLEDAAHPMVEVPPESPIANQDKFQEFMSRIIGNSDLDNEELTAVEAGYMGYFFDQKLSLSLELYWNHTTNLIGMFSDIALDANGLPDLDKSIIIQINSPDIQDFVGGELSIRYMPINQMLLMGSWTHKEFLFNGGRTEIYPLFPADLFSIGAFYWLDNGLTGSATMFVQSSYHEGWVENPKGIMEPPLQQDIDWNFLVMGKIGWRWTLQADSHLETGIKLFLPISPFSEPHSKIRERAGGTTPFGDNYGGEALTRTLTGYIEIIY